LNATASWSTMWPISHQFLLGVGAELPLFNRGREAEQESAGLMIDGARASLEDARARAEAAQAEARARDEGAARALSVLQERVVPLAAARADTARAALGGGATIDMTLDATRAELDARARLVRAQGERCRARAELWRAAGVSFATGSSSQEQP
ncbi:MAG: TolC family protein, partial [Deltaproteobacteria bacterium]|nr:TolC family protein [Deltaproteobacteria bacterium]